MRNYAGKHVYIGIDVHKATYAITALVEGVMVKKDIIEAQPQKLIDYCKRFFPNGRIHSAYEAGFSGFSLHRQLARQGIDNRVVHAASIEIAARDRVKNDRRDSMKIATQLSAGRLDAIHVPTEEMERHRSLSRLREQLQKQRTRIGNQLKSFLHYHGHMAKDGHVCLSWIERQMQRSLPEEYSLAVQMYGESWKHYHKQIASLDRRLKDQAITNVPLETIYRSMPGIGPIASRVLANELGDMSQFARETQLFSYLGLTPCEYSSGEQIRRGSISRQGKPIFRKILVQSAWVAIRYDPELDALFSRLSHRRGKKRAIVGVARNLAGRLYSCLKRGEKYQIRK